MSYDITDYIPFVPKWLPMGMKPFDEPQGIKAKVEKVGNRIIARTDSLADRILLGNKAPSLIEVIN